MQEVKGLNEYGLPIWKWPNGAETTVYVMFGNRGRVIFSNQKDAGSDGYTDGWCYDSLLEAFFAWVQWIPSETPEPDGWVKHVNTGRRRIGGDARFEYSNFDEELVVRARMKAEGVLIFE